MLLHKRKLTYKITTITKQSHPKERTSNAEHKKATVGHGTYSGNKRSKCSDNRNKPGDDDRLATMFFKKTIGSDKMFRIKKSGSLIIKHFWSKLVADQIVEVISKQGC